MTNQYNLTAAEQFDQEVASIRQHRAARQARDAFQDLLALARANLRAETHVDGIGRIVVTAGQHEPTLAYVNGEDISLYELSAKMQNAWLDLLMGKGARA